MQKNGKKFFITTPIYYVNDVPHIGHAYTTIAADVVSRYKKLEGYEVFFLTGTDEHGQKVDQAAKNLGVDAQQHVDKLNVRFKELWVRFNICNNDFIRTTEDRHKAIVLDILKKLFDKGEIYKASYEGWYCTPDERFWTEKDLVKGNCPECGRKVEKITESNYFFKMGQYQDWLIEHIKNNESFIQPASRKNEVLGFLSKPLEDLCISRPTSRMSWGIPLPFDDDYVTYVWFDALINYISTFGTLDKIRASGFWPADHHLVGKDILTTHAVYWSTMLKAMDLPLPKNIFAHGWWTVNGQKMSKSLFNVVEPNSLIDQFGVDTIRYFLLREVPFGLDGDFSHKALIGRRNSDLANNLGNLLNRTTNMIQKYFSGTIPEPATGGEEDTALCSKAEQTVSNVRTLYGDLAYNKILAKIWELVDATNQYIVKTAPWNLAKTDEGKERLKTVMYNSAESLRTIAILIYPFMPESADSMNRQLGVDVAIEEQGMESIAKWGGLKPGNAVQSGAQLFPRIEDKEAEKILASIQSSAGSEKPQIAESKKEDMDQITIDDFMKVDLRTGKILEAEKVKKSKKLIKLKVDIGTETRQVLAGIAEAYEPDQLIGKTIVLVANLKPVKLMGIKSEGMVIAGSADGKIILAGFDTELPEGVRVR
ncbi:Methionyl-tRNA synthetase [hydrothermal vent metagenome]|uniref:Methionine--tRNA ligase n=1 Tax=hydrothermal vent metagenome TaxID=652676 RepID=A0A3B1CPL8_9ZZZZ